MQGLIPFRRCTPILSFSLNWRSALVKTEPSELLTLDATNLAAKIPKKPVEN